MNRTKRKRLNNLIKKRGGVLPSGEPKEVMRATSFMLGMMAHPSNRKESIMDAMGWVNINQTAYAHMLAFIKEMDTIKLLNQQADANRRKEESTGE